MKKTVALKHALYSFELHPLFFRNLVPILRGVSIPPHLSVLVPVYLLHCQLHMLPNFHQLQLLRHVHLNLLLLQILSGLHALSYLQVLA